MEIVIANQKRKYFDCLLTKMKEHLWLSVIPRELEFCISCKKHIAKWAYLCTYFQLLLIGLCLYLFPTLFRRPVLEKVY